MVPGLMMSWKMPGGMDECFVVDFYDLYYKGDMAAGSEIDVPKLFADVGYLEPAAAMLRVPFAFQPPAVAAPAALEPKPQPRCAPQHVQRQSAMTALFALR